MMYVRPPVADLLAEPDPRAERISQLTCFTPCEVLEGKGDFLFVRGPDGYRGWIRESYLFPGPAPEPTFKVAWPIVPVKDSNTGEEIFRLCLDTRFAGEAFEGGIKLRLPTGAVGSIPKGAVRSASWRGTVRDILVLSLSLRGTPYLWGGTTPFGFDCSGLVQRLFHFVLNLWLPRDSADQARVGDPVECLSDLQPGDLLFFPGHVALYLGDGAVLHASAREGMVASALLSSLPGDLRGARRIHPDIPPSPILDP